jgi:hypothetical protein
MVGMGAERACSTKVPALTVRELCQSEQRVGHQRQTGRRDRMHSRSFPDRRPEGGVVGSEETIMLDRNQSLMPERDLWNKARRIGQKRPLKSKDVWSIRVGR